jgi:hypothetical protein
MVVGVAANSKYFTLGEDDTPVIYEPNFQVGWNRANLHFLVRTSAPPASMSQNSS